MNEKMKDLLAAVRERTAEEMHISFDSNDLIAEVKEDIAAFGRDYKVNVWARLYPQYNKVFIVNYDFIIPDDPITEEDIGRDETVSTATLGDLLAQLKKQNSLMGDD